MLTYEGKNYGGTTKFNVLATHLFSSFTSKDAQISSNELTAFYQLKAIHGKNYATVNESLWDGFDANFTSAEIARAIEELKDTKGNGPMDISVAFIKYNLTSFGEYFQPIVRHWSTACIMESIIPNTNT